MKKQILLFLLTLVPMMASAFTGEVEIDGINYFIKTGGQVAEVRAKNPKYSGDVVIPPTVEYEGVTCNVLTIGQAAFYGCTSLTSVTIPNSVTSIGSDAFYGCTGMKSVHITDLAAWCNISFGYNPLSHAHHLYQNGAEVKDLVIPSSVTSISKIAFSGCTSLTSVTIPNSVTSIGSSAFSSCTSLTSVTIPNSVTSIGNGVFSGCTSLTSVTIPNSVTSIGSSAFSSCTSLTSVTIPNSVTSIEISAFQGCTGLNSITFGNNIRSINHNAFVNCPDLTHVYCHAVNVPWTASDVFNGSYPQYATLHVPDESVDAYRNYNPWSQFGTIIGLSGGGNNKCAKPTISYSQGQLQFASATEGVTFQSSISDTDINSYNSSTINLNVTYNISVYATKSGMENSDVAYATLCWIDKEPTITNDTGNAIELSATPVIIQSDGGQLTIQGADDGTPINIYTSAGIHEGSAVSSNGKATIGTNLQSGSIAIVKIGSKSVKVVMK